MGEAEEEGKLAVIFDANVVIASLIKENGLNRYIVMLTPIIYPCITLKYYEERCLCTYQLLFIKYCFKSLTTPLTWYKLLQYIILVMVSFMWGIDIIATMNGYVLCREVTCT